MVLADITEGTAQAKLDNSGMNARPDNPLVDNKLSNRKAARGK
ncbi:FeoB protein [[Mannheimia] succiniciproducens MBEL55E]|uniref:FeoB protein n=1 Tax=Mannheimia succiniciproducens (strain KCTC 0769BP / MBEL55E) TaxID=221988 RepID=Q65TE5_MANSM|nr:FeoB protein [[Mannheimia] succiniciproducens MBEL55E]